MLTYEQAHFGQKMANNQPAKVEPESADRYYGALNFNPLQNRSMSKLIKEEVIAQFTAAYVAQHGKQPVIEQKGSWFKIDDGKSVRLAELAAMATQFGDLIPAQPQAVVAKKTAAAKTPVKVTGTGGMTPKQLWAEQIAKGSKLPRGH